MTTPALGASVIYRSRTGNYALPATVTATVDTLYAGGLIPPLSSPDHVHLTVFTPGERVPGSDPAMVGANQGGTYQEWDVPLSATVDTAAASAEHTPTQEPGTWAWPA